MSVPFVLGGLEFDIHRHWLLVEHARIDNQAHSAILENAKMARDFIDKMNGDFHSHNRSAGQRRRWANYRRANCLG